MHPRKTPAFRRLTLVMAVQALWIGCPSVGCICAGGQIKLLCDAYLPGPLKQHRESVRGCCGGSAPGVESRGGGCCDGPATGLSGHGCKRVLTTPVLAPESGPKHLPLEIALGSSPADPVAVVSATSRSTGWNGIDTGPPSDLLLRLHRLLL